MKEENHPGPVGWFLSADLLRKGSQIAKSMIANELDLRDWMGREDRPIDFSHESDLWFDYVADTGDDWIVMRTIGNLITKDQAHGDKVLPVGRFLFVGGDTAYHVADETTLRQRFVGPFLEGMGKETKAWTRPLIGIPGNHDYYDNLVGFNRMFRSPLDEDKRGVLEITNHDLVQQASYVKVLLPHRWQLWGVDLGPNGLDYRQHRYFGAPPDKLILCTPTPPITFDRVRVKMGDHDDDEYRGYKRLFGKEDAQDAQGATKFVVQFVPADVASHGLGAGQCRLHVAGDDHNYQRYGGSSSTADDRDVPACASIVAGGGGAFLHPTETSHGEVKRTACFPTEDTSRELMVPKIRNPFTLGRGGFVWLLGGVVAAILYATFPASWSALGPAAIFCGSLAVAGIALLWARHASAAIGKARKDIAKSRRRRGPRPATKSPRKERRKQKQATKQMRDPWPIAIVVALGAPFAARAISPRVDPLAPESVFLVLAILFTIVLVVFARGSAGPSTGARATFTLFGLLHAIGQLGLGVSVVLQGSAVTVGVLAASVAILALVAPWLYKKRQRYALVLLWIAQGPGMVALLWLGPRIGLGPPLLAEYAHLYPVAFAVGAVLALYQLGFYLIVAGAFHGHNNELGAAARITRFKHWIRFHVEENRVTGYVLGIRDPSADPPTAEVVDVFSVTPKNGAA